MMRLPNLPNLRIFFIYIYIICMLSHTQCNLRTDYVRNSHGITNVAVVTLVGPI